MAQPPSGRLVWNHSTHIPGLIPILEKLLKRQTTITTITPAVIGRSRAHSPKLTIRVSVPVRGGFKLIARKGKQFQEVFVITTLEKPALEEAIADVLTK
ncbi:MAG: metal-binding protein [Leptolyngbya sp. DLM2.Bin15]|nr:MAG: metal-binding protein [Leptolyngbya sp. DLM2.Bin15]